MTYAYDANGRQTSASAIAGSPSQTSVYDCSGQRVQTSSGGVTRTMVYNIFGQQVADYNSTTMQRENIYRAGQLLAVNEASGGLSYVLTDVQGSTRALMNNSGSGSSTITSRHDYLPFGEEILAGTGLRTTTQKYSQSDNVRRRFAMLERDDVTGLDHTWFRKYENRAGRWTSTDPYAGSMSLGDPQSFNRYSYVENDPVNLVDPSGLLPCAGIEVLDPATGRSECLSLPPETVTITISRADRIIESRGADHGVDYGLRGFITLRPLATPQQIRAVKECEMFAIIVAGLANDSDPEQFVNAVWDQFAQDQDINKWGSDGFKDTFKDNVGPGNSPNQIRHYVGGLWAGFAFGSAGNFLADMREAPGVDFSGAKVHQNNPVPKPQNHTLSQLADMRLNAVSTAHGNALQNGTLKPSELANRIRTDVCE